MSGLTPPQDYDPRRLFPFGLSPIPEVPSELASEVSSVYSYYEEDDEDEDEVGTEDEEEARSHQSIMYSGSCSSVKSNRTLDRPDDEDATDHESDEEDEDTEVEDEDDEAGAAASTSARSSESATSTSVTSDREHYNSLVTHVMHQRAFNFDPNQSGSSSEHQPEVVVSEHQESSMTSFSELNHVQTHVVEAAVANDQHQQPQQQQLVDVSPGAATASEIFRHLQATHGKEAITTELAKILNVLHTTLQEEEEEDDSCSGSSSAGSSHSGSNSGTDSESRSSSEDEEAEPHPQVAAPQALPTITQPEVKTCGPISGPTSTAIPSTPAKAEVGPKTQQGVPLGKPPKYPSTRTSQMIGPNVEERIRELSSSKPGRSGKEEMQILSKILVTLLCSCRTPAATQELKKIIRHFKDAAAEAGDEFANENVDIRSTTSSRRRRSSTSSKRKRRRRRWSSGATSSHSSHGSEEADSQTNTLTPCNTDSRSSGTDDERDVVGQPSSTNGTSTRRKSDPFVSARLRFNVVVEDPPEVKVAAPSVEEASQPETNVTFTISLPRRSSTDSSAESNPQLPVPVVAVVDVEPQEDEEDEEDEWEWEEDDDTGETGGSNSVSQRQDSLDSCGSMTTRKLLTDMECGAYNSDSLGSPSAGTSGPSGEQSNNQSPSGIESRPESMSDYPRKRRSRESSTNSNNNLFTHLEETFKVLNGAYKIITGTKPDVSNEVNNNNNVNNANTDDHSRKTFEEVLEGVSAEVANVENEIRKTSSRPTSKMSRKSGVQSRADETGEDEDEDGWEYYYEDEEEEEEEQPQQQQVVQQQVQQQQKVQQQQQVVQQQVQQQQHIQQQQVIQQQHVQQQQQQYVQQQRLQQQQVHQQYLQQQTAQQQVRYEQVMTTTTLHSSTTDDSSSNNNNKHGLQVPQTTQQQQQPGSRPSSRQTRSRPSSRTGGSRPNSRLRTKTPLGGVAEGDENNDDDWEWEYYYEEDEDETECEAELQRLSPTMTTAPTTRATSPFPPDLPSHMMNRADIISPVIVWEEVDPRSGQHFVFQPEMGMARESTHVGDLNMTTTSTTTTTDAMVSVALAAEVLGQRPSDLAAGLPPNFLLISEADNVGEDRRHRKSKKDDRSGNGEKRERRKRRSSKDGKFLPKVGVKELVNRLEPKLFQDVETGTKMVMDQNVASSNIAKQKKVSNNNNNVIPSSISSANQPSKPTSLPLPIQPNYSPKLPVRVIEEPPSPAAVIVHSATNPNQVTVHQGGQSTVVTMRRSGGARNKEPLRQKPRSPSEGSEAYGTGSTTSALDQGPPDDDEGNGGGGGGGGDDQSRSSSRHSRLFRLLQDSDYTDSETDSRAEYGSCHRISLKGVEDLVSKESDMDSLSSIERKPSFRSIRSSGKESDCESISSAGRADKHLMTSSSMQKEMAVKRFMTLNLHPRDLYASSSELSTPNSPTYPNFPQLPTSAGDCPPHMMSPERRRAAAAAAAAAAQAKSGQRLSSAGGDLYRNSPIRNSPKLELELLELSHLPSAPSFAMRNLHRNGKL